jgi:protein-L-isoaspartate O-methyltransferase
MEHRMHFLRGITTEQQLPVDDFASEYCELRRKEGRMYSDVEVASLPHIEPAHQHYKEWQTRKYSAYRLCKYLIAKKRPLNILDIGCGNGWLSAMFAEIPGAQVLAVDVNQEELMQARRVFHTMENLQFESIDVESGLTTEDQFDVIVFAASIQYFPNLSKTLRTLLDHLWLSGEIHIVDSPLYKPDQVAAARERSCQYYSHAGFPSLATHYFHHPQTILEGFNTRMLYDPAKTLQRAWHRHPFPWIKIMQPYQ